MVGSPATEDSKDEIWESAKRRNAMKGFSSDSEEEERGYGIWYVTYGSRGGGGVLSLGDSLSAIVAGREGCGYEIYC
jgi:hypothetical protein